MEHLVGYIVIGLSVVLTGGFLLWRWLAWKKTMPKDYHRGVGIRYLKGAVQPWDHWKECVDACLAVIQNHETFKKDFAKLSDFWIEAIPYDQPLLNPTILTGWVYENERTLRTAPKPTNEEEAVTRKRVGGSVKTERCFPWTKKQHIIQIVQGRKGDSDIDFRLMRGTGETKPLDQTAFFYEFAKRHVEFVLTGSYMALSSVEPIYAELEGKIGEEYRRNKV